VNFLLDANVVSEWVKPRPNSGVVAWLETADEDRLFLSVATLAELSYGIERLPVGRKSAQLREWLEIELTGRFEGRVVVIDEARADAAGRPVGAMDGFLAATAAVHQMTLVTRNEMDFAATGIKTFNPWSE
jgi:predicted nucleic acid-binding protein